jgi:hypothetical protein
VAVEGRGGLAERRRDGGRERIFFVLGTNVTILEIISPKNWHVWLKLQPSKQKKISHWLARASSFLQKIAKSYKYPRLFPLFSFVRNFWIKLRTSQMQVFEHVCCAV